MKKEVLYTVSLEGRDKGKVFKLTEMPAAQAEKWGIRALMAMTRGGVEVPDAVMSEGIAGLARFGVGALLKADFRDVEPLLDEMMCCIQIVPDPAQQNVVRSLVDSDIEEVPTIFVLRRALFALQTGF